VWKREGKRPFERPRHRREDDIKLDGSSGSGMWGMDWIDLAVGRDKWWTLVNSLFNLGVP
jgi:hypothetical protein